MYSPSRADVSSSYPETDLSADMIVEKNSNINMMGTLVQQLERIIKLLEEIAPKKEDNANLEATTSREEKHAPDDAELTEHVKTRRLKLYRAALNGDWEVAKRIYDDSDIGVGISKSGETLLHIAAGAKSIDFVKELVKKMNKKDINKKDKQGRTALFLAAASGMVELAKEIMKNNKEIATEANNHSTLPIYMAAALGHGDMVKYLYEETKDSLNEDNCKELFITSIETDLYDFALQLLKDFPYLATARAHTPAIDSKTGVTALHVLARKHLKFSNLANQNQRGIFKSCFNLGAKDVEDKKRQLVELIWEKVVLLSDSKISKLIAEPQKLIFDAAKRGNDEFLCILIREYPDLIWKFDNKENNYSIFHFAVTNRQENVFKHIHEISRRETFLMCEDKEDNNILHLAGMLAPQDRLNTVPGAALQMQRELLWFKKVKEVVPPNFAEAKNKKGFTPSALFTKEHEDLREKGEKWMKETATSCMVVAALIATVAFAAAITVPGGNNGETGFPFFLGKLSFKIFAISDAISLVSSSTSIIYFLSILTSRYAEKDFLSSLPRKLRFGLVTLLLSIATMMAVFSTTFFIVFNDQRLWIAILITIIASIPVIVFFWLHVKLFRDILRPTDSIFQQGKSSLFRKEGEASDKRRMVEISNALLKYQCTCSSTCSTNV